MTGLLRHAYNGLELSVPRHGMVGPPACRLGREELEAIPVFTVHGNTSVAAQPNDGTAAEVLPMKRKALLGMALAALCATAYIAGPACAG